MIRTWARAQLRSRSWEQSPSKRDHPKAQVRKALENERGWGVSGRWIYLEASRALGEGSFRGVWADRQTSVGRRGGGTSLEYLGWALEGRGGVTTGRLGS